MLEAASPRLYGYVAPLVPLPPVSMVSPPTLDARVPPKRNHGHSSKRFIRWDGDGWVGLGAGPPMGHHEVQPTQTRSQSGSSKVVLTHLRDLRLTHGAPMGAVGHL